ASGVLEVEIDAGKPALVVSDLDFGIFSLPGVAEGAASDLVDAVADFNDVLADLDGELQDLRIYADRVSALGIQRGAPITPDRVLDRIRSTAGSLEIDITVPDQEYAPGVDAVSVDGSSYYVALGDSLAANVGIGRPGRGYVSKFHEYVSSRDGVAYGLRNFGVSGETSSSIFDGQLDDAVAFMESNDVAYVSIDIGANDFLGHLSSGDCAADIESGQCLERLDATYVRYRSNIAEILDVISDAAPDATILFMTAYNPFSFGLASEVAFEQASSEITVRFNDIAASTAEERGMLVADGFGAIVARALVLTHMLDDPADIHPTQAGYDRLTDALVDALEGTD
ncbi:MAG: SGNH/GDSL hydrolase family protein, partial [Acidimicrobiia bacterium]|nr:SGNH/GDSL hydrolase family protein [Acidimicrobiia bacterium]